jgi:NADPH-dependent curcumin reductase CurA
MQGLIVFDYAKRYREAGLEMGQWMMEGKLKTEETIEEGIENFLPTFKKLFNGQKKGKLLLDILDKS